MLREVSATRLNYCDCIEKDHLSLYKTFLLHNVQNRNTLGIEKKMYFKSTLVLQERKYINYFPLKCVPSLMFISQIERYSGIS